MEPWKNENSIDHDIGSDGTKKVPNQGTIYIDQEHSVISYVSGKR